MIEINDAKRLAYGFIRSLAMDIEPEHRVINDTSVREEEFGWVFFWNDGRYIRTGDGAYALCGNLPVVVLRETGQVFFLPSPAAPESMDQESLLKYAKASRSIDGMISALAIRLLGRRPK